MIFQFLLYVLLVSLGLYAHEEAISIFPDGLPYSGLMCHSTSLSKSASGVGQGDDFYSLCGGPMPQPYHLPSKEVSPLEAT